jgi:hypothetical protein
MPRTKAEKTKHLQAEITAVLTDAGSALHFSELTERVSHRGNFKEFGADPASEVYYAIYNDIATNGENSPFLKAGRGIFMLRSQSQAAIPALDVKLPEAEGPERVAGIVKGFGMYWRRDRVSWKNNAKLLGQQQPNTPTVDFCGQRGVYLLHDGREVVYIGRTTDQPLGQRLFQHTYDRLNGRWDRLSWFGILAVAENGTLSEPDFKSLTADDLITTMEALLIEGLEPPQNRKRGDEFQAVEYLQVEDPAIEKQRRKDLADRILLGGSVGT